MSPDEVRVDPWLTEVAIAALSGPLLELVPSGTVGVLGAAADGWKRRLGARAEVLSALEGAATNSEVRLSAVAVVSPDALPREAEGEAAFVAGLVARTDVALVATVNPAGATGGRGRWPAYWEALFALHGWQLLDVMRPALWDDSQLAPDVKEGALLFVAPSVVPPAAPRSGDFPKGSSAVLHPHRLTETRRALDARLAAHLGATEVWQRTMEDALRSEIEHLKAAMKVQGERLGALQARQAVGERRWGDVADHALRVAAPFETRARSLLRRVFRPPMAPPVPAMIELFDAPHYASQNAAGVAASLQHYLKVGEDLGLRPNPYFDPVFYRSENPDVVTSGVSAFGHYVLFGGYEGRPASAQFNTAWYVTSYPDVVLSGLHPLLHFLVVGRAAGYLPVPA